MATGMRQAARTARGWPVAFPHRLGVPFAGEMSPVLPSTEGYRILKVISKEPSGQRELTDPRVQQTIRETLLNRKDQLLKAAYYETARNEAKVVNYLARTVVDNAGKAGK